MKKLSILLLLILALTLVFAACDDPVEPGPGPDVPSKTVTQTQVVLYDGPEIMQSSSVASVKVEDKDVFVYDTRVNHERRFTFLASNDYNQVVIFDFEGRVNVEVTINDATSLHNVVVRPLARNVQPTVSGNKISFTLDYCDNYVVEYGLSAEDRASKNALHVFANPIEEDPIDPENLPEKTVYVGPGVWMANSLPVYEDGTTVYLAGGAVVYGQIRTANVSNLTIRGRGILTGQLFNRNSASEFTLPIELQNCSNVTIKDIAILDPAGWAVTLYCCSDVMVDNLKIITARANGDGISVQSCQNVTVTGGFVRSWDDSLVVKNTDNKSTSNITFDGVYVWTDLAQSMEVGYETYGATMTDITFKNITVLHNFHKAAMSIHNADNAAISRVTYQDITIEDAQMRGDNQLDTENDLLIDITIAYNTEWTQSKGERGTVSDVTFKNVKVLQMADTIVCRIFGEGNSSNVNGVSISDFEIEGQKINSLEDLKLTPGVYTSNIKYSSSKNQVTGAAAKLPYKLELASETPQIKQVESIHQEGLEVPSFAMQNNEPTYAGKLIDTSDVTISATLGAGDRASSPWNNSTVADTTGNEVSRLIDGNRSTAWTFDGWTGVDKEFLALNFEFAQPTRIGNIRFLGSETSNVMRYLRVAMFYKADDGTWKRFQVETELSLSPQASNYTDFLLSRTSFTGIQIRIFMRDDITHPKTISLGEIQFYPPSLTTGKAASASVQEDVYNIEKMVDGNPLTYFESAKGVFPAYVEIDMENPEQVKYINIHLPPLLLWENRTQEIEILGSLDGKTYFTVVAKTEYLFDSSAGNMIALVLDSSVETRYIKLVFTSNSTGYGAQISELYVYGE